MVPSPVLDAPSPSAHALSGMSFSLSDEQEAIRRMVREFAESEIAPHVKEWDEAQTFPR
jgi:hypothetical protein